MNIKERYDEAFFSIKNKLLKGNRRGLINLIFWHLPLILIEGKVIAAFFEDVVSTEPLIDTIRIPEDTELFTYGAFKKSMCQWSAGKELYRNQKHEELPESDRKFDCLDYFGVPCFNPGTEGVNCRIYLHEFYEIHCFGGKLEIYVAFRSNYPEADPNNQLVEEFLRFDHKLALGDLLGSLAKLIKKYFPDALSGEKVKSDFLKGFSSSNTSPFLHRKQPQSLLRVSDYMRSAFENLHQALIESLGWYGNPCRLFIVINAESYGPKVVFFLTKNQQEYFRKSLARCSQEIATNIINEIKTVHCAKIKTEINQYYDLLSMPPSGVEKNTLDKANTNLPFEQDEFFDIAFSALRKIPQSYTVSSFFKERGLHELFLEGETSFADHPLICKADLIKKDLNRNSRLRFDYPAILEPIEELFLMKLPNIENSEDGFQFEFAMIPYFFKDRPLGCIAFFNPDVLGKRQWYDYLVKVFALLDEREDVIYEAAVNDLCQDILRSFEDA